MIRGQPSSISRLPVAGLLAMALLARLLIPAGWMPGSDASGFRLEFCSGYGSPAPAILKAAENVAKRLNGGKHRGKDRASGAQACGFGALGLAWNTDAPSAIVTPAIFASPIIASARVVATRRGLAAPPPPATGPPDQA